MTECSTKFRLMPRINAMHRTESLCTHEHTPYTGAIPCTGVSRCSMCGMTFKDSAEAHIARMEAKQVLFDLLGRRTI